MHIKKLDISGVGWLAAGWQTDDYIVGWDENAEFPIRPNRGLHFSIPPNPRNTFPIPTN